jgi:hypothetical protein
MATPYQKPKGKALSESQKIENQAHNAWRIKIEFRVVLGRCKRFRTLKDKIGTINFTLEMWLCC